MSTVSDKSSEGSEHHRLLCCVNSTREIPSLYIQYSSGNIHLMKCEYCRAIADPYIKCEFMIILIDLILYKRITYLHLLFNILNLCGDDKVIIECYIGKFATDKSFWQFLSPLQVVFDRNVEVWEFTSSVLYIIDLLVLSSNALALGGFLLIQATFSHFSPLPEPLLCLSPLAVEIPASPPFLSSDLRAEVDRRALVFLLAASHSVERLPSTLGRQPR
ncbi:hypothetical protein ZIOFF_035726 [Zingiber officinale]|uniref:Protein ARV n=1 Tax=Zingiber officinale TaxID=94328 RepID=A0A8J5GKX4_ZINOF|nr:hypothetical protein ZIOFF_035726 [Zingiber officinale]